MDKAPETAVVYCQDAFATMNGKTAHGLVRATNRYRVAAVVDRSLAGRDAGEALDGRFRSIPLVATIEDGLGAAKASGAPATRLVVGLAPDGGRLEPEHRQAMKGALMLGLSIDSGLHDFLSEDPELAALAAEKGLTLTDVRKTPPRGELHGFSGVINQVDCLKVAVLGTDSALGKRTTALLLTSELTAMGVAAEMIGTGQTSWMQGVRYGLILDSLINDFVAGEIEHAVHSAWRERRPRVIVVEGQGSLMNPAYPGGFEILAAARPELVIMQHAPARKEYDGFPGYPLHGLRQQIEATEMVSGRKVAAVTVNHELMDEAQTRRAMAEIAAETGLFVSDVVLDGPGPLARFVAQAAQEMEAQR